MPRLRSFACLTVAIAMLGIFATGPAACDDTGVPQPCTSIPAGGCPLSHGVACDDPACEAIYACRPDNVWELRERCPAHDAAIGTAARDASDEDVDASPPTVFDAAVDAPPGAYGGPGCESLQSPDCSLGLVLSCNQGCCGCEDLFVCDQGGWTLWGTCTDGGVTH